MLDPKRVVTLLRMGDTDVLPFIKETYLKIAHTTIQHRLSIPSVTDLEDCCDLVEEHMGFRPDREIMSSFLAIEGTKLKSRIMEFNAADTEVRSELLDAVSIFCVGCPHIEDPQLDALICEQWNAIWSQT